jgi:predicted XRE-type DNA-binding protein
MAIKKVTKRKQTKTELNFKNKILKDIKAREAKGEILGSASLDIYNSVSDRFKWGICREIMRFKIRQNLSSQKIGELMGADKSKASQILNCRVENFSIERLLNHLVSLGGIEKQIDEKIEDIFNLFSEQELAS